MRAQTLDSQPAMQDDERRIAFEILYAEHAAPVYRFALRLAGNPEDAEDLAAQALAKAYRQLSGFKGSASPRTWLFAILLNEWRMLHRKRPQREDRLESVRHLASTFQFTDTDLADAILSLPETLREAFLLVKGEGLTHAEAAEAAKVPVGTMYFRVHTAISQLRKKLAPLEETSTEVIAHEM